MATRKSTNINELPSMNSLANQRSDDDDAIANINNIPLLSTRSIFFYNPTYQ